MPSAAQDELQALAAHTEDRYNLDGGGGGNDDQDDNGRTSRRDADEETSYQRARVDAAMRVPVIGASELKLPPASFDSGYATGVKGVIADARAFQSARRSTKFAGRARTAEKASNGLSPTSNASGVHSSSGSDTDEAHGAAVAAAGDEEAFLRQWRESRRRDLESEPGRAVRTRRTSPSVRIYGRLDDVNALGYLDAVEKVGRGTKVVVFVHDEGCEVSTKIEEALLPLVRENPAVHFVKVSYDEIEFDPAAVPSLLAYQNQGEIFANMTGLIEMMPIHRNYGSSALRAILQQHQVL